uniref:C2 domain-containing protein n=1 Tax=Phytophthora fragariae TaxID=53985 RepID=A0A6A3FZN6_9STRA|nr:hypothetical protein PF009_g101 [Phytophthora fragariae]
MMEEEGDAGRREDGELSADAAISCRDAETEQSDVPSPRTKHLKEDEDSDANAWGGKDAAGHDNTAETKQSLPVPIAESGLEARFHAFSPTSIDDDDEDAGNYQIVKKSIYKPHRKGFLSRLTGGAPVASTKKKYALNDITGIVTGEEAEAANLSPMLDEKEMTNEVDLTIEEEEGIEVAVDRSAKTPRGARPSREQRRLSAEDAALGGPSEVVIHSGDSEAGFATLNPIIGSNVQRSVSSHGAVAAPAMTKSAAVPVAKASPILLEIPVAEQANKLGRDRLLLIINALGATGLPKAEKFGTQSCLLEMRLFDGTTAEDGNPITSWSSYLMRTELHKKGGSEAQWNQQFTTTLCSKETQFLHVKVKTSSKILVGEANVPLDKVGDLFYDQHYPLFRTKSDMDSEIVNHIDPNNDAPLHVAARHGDLACLQLLLHHGADICVVEEFGRTPLHCAVANGNLDCVAYLLDVGGDSVLNSGDHDGDTALHYASLSGNEAIVRLLLESAANVFATNIHKETSYDIAVREKQQSLSE